MPDKKKQVSDDLSADQGEQAVPSDCTGCALPRCVNCRRELEASMSRIANRKMRQMRSMDECSIGRCLAFVRSIKDEAMRMHLASMAWWRFSADSSGVAGPLLDIARNSRAEVPDYGPDYMHRVLKVLSPLTEAQLSTWFGCTDLYHLVDAFMEDRPAVIGINCAKCGLYKQGCTTYNMLGADECQLWNDEFVQAVAGVVSKTGKWSDPVKGIGKV